MRGKVQLRNGKQTSRGITPAYAGKRWTVAGTVAARWDHPRVCGEKASLMLASDAELGSPPRMRGKVREIKTGKSRRGITPAYAGKRRRCCAFRWLPWDHPRVCGEKQNVAYSFAPRSGSPPRMRGKGFSTFPWLSLLRITPAYAGKRLMSSNSLTAHRDHPRVCGEKTQCAMKVPPCEGSPPRMRGKASPNSETLTVYGITPAYAGKRFGPGRWQSSWQDHPRVCGEKIVFRQGLTGVRGSPPRMRGKASK